MFSTSLQVRVTARVFRERKTLVLRLQVLLMTRTRIMNRASIAILTQAFRTLNNRVVSKRASSTSPRVTSSQHLVASRRPFPYTRWHKLHHHSYILNV